jgi:hypothetical protein
MFAEHRSFAGRYLAAPTANPAHPRAAGPFMQKAAMFGWIIAGVLVCPGVAGTQPGHQLPTDF